MEFIKGRISKLNSKKRTYSPREWSSNDRCFYEQCIHQAQYIGYVPSSIAYTIAEIVRDTSVLKSDWKKVARSLGMNNEGQLKSIEDAAGWKQELPLYIALTTQYMINSASSLGRLLDCLIKLERYDILIKIKDDIQDAIDEHNGLRIAKSPYSSKQKLKKDPVEEDSVASMVRDKTTEYDKSKTTSSHLVNSSCSNYWRKYSENESNSDSAFYDQHSPPNSFIKILSKNNETTKNDYLIDCCHSSHKKDIYDKKSNWKDRSQNKENYVENKIGKLDPAGTLDFQFIDPTSKNQCLTTNSNDIELNSENSNAHFYEVIDSRMVAETSLPSTAYISCSVEESKECVRSCNKTCDEYYDSDTTYDEDFDINLGEQAFGVTNLCSQATEASALLVDGDHRRKENERCQYLSISEYEGPYSAETEDHCSGADFETYDINNSVNESIEELVAEKDEYEDPGSAETEDHCSGTDFETYNINNSVNESIEELVAEKDENLRNVERAERESISALVSLKIQETVKKPHDHLLSIVSNVLPSERSIDVGVSIKVIVIHSEQDSGTAIAIAAALVKEFNMAAVAECQLNAIWLLDPSHYRRTALHWADVIVPVITNTWLEDINNEKPPMEREVSSLNARSVFKILQNMFLNRGSVNLSSVPVVMEGTSLRFRNYPEIRDAIKLSRDFGADGCIKKLGELIKGFYIITRDVKKSIDY